MKDDIRKKFYDILFETEPDTEPEEPKETVNEPKRKEPHYSAKEILYNDKASVSLKADPKPSLTKAEETKKASSFLTLSENLTPTGIKTYREPEPIKKPEYQIKPNISPMFGLIEDEKETVVQPVASNTSKKTKKTSTGYLNTIISPFYGYTSESMNDTLSMQLEQIREAETKKEDTAAFSLDEIMKEASDLPIDLFEDLFKR